MFKFLNGSFVYSGIMGGVGGVHKYFFIKDLKLGMRISMIELSAGRGAQLVRAAGTSAKLVTSTLGGKYRLQLPSSKYIYIHGMARACVGSCANKQHRKVTLSKAGTARRLGRGLRVRGVAMNAVDHPHGGKSGPSRVSVSP